MNILYENEHHSFIFYGLTEIDMPKVIPFFISLVSYAERLKMETFKKTEEVIMSYKD